MADTDRNPTESNLKEYFAHILTDKGEATEIRIDHDYFEWACKKPTYKEIFFINVKGLDTLYVKETKDVLIPHTLIEVTDFLSGRKIIINTEYLLNAGNVLVVKYKYKDKRTNKITTVHKKVHYSKKGKLKLV